MHIGPCPNHQPVIEAIIRVSLSLLVIRLSSLCHFGFGALSQPKNRSILTRKAKKPSMTVRCHGDSRLFPVPLAFNGRMCLLRTNSRRVAELAEAFFPQHGNCNGEPVCANLVLIESESRKSSAANDNFPVFRGRREYVHADYGRYGSVWFDLKAREIFGNIASAVIADALVFRSSVLAVIAGMLAPALEMVAIHAGCVVRGGKAILLAAPAGTGKSTIALTLARRGWKLLSDDWTFVAERGRALRAWGMWTSIKLLPDATRFFPELAAVSPGVALNGESSYEVDAWEMFYLERAIDADPAAIVHLRRDDAALRCRVAKSDGQETYRALMGEIEEQPLEMTGAEKARRGILQRLCRLPSLEVRFGGEPEEVAEELDALLAEKICG